MNNPFEGPKLFSPSFVDALRAYAPELLETKAATGTMPEVPHGTTVAALRFADGVAMGGDRRATEGMTIAQRDIEKVFPADDFSAVGLASRTAAVWAAVPRVGSSMGTRWRVSRPMSKMIASQPAAAIWGA